MPESIGRYEIIHELGKGGMAIVYLARDPYMKRQVAVKVLPRQFTFDPQFRARFHREAEAIAALEHPAIVPVYDYGEHDEQPYIVMRYMPGGSLADRMAKGRLPLDEIAALFDRLAAALDIAHGRGMIHRDLKPGNILFDEWGGAYLSDFGIVKMTEASAAFTGTGIIGTPAYMSPEQAAAKKEVDGRSDVYSLGVVLFELLTGQLPYKADTPLGLALAHATEPIPDIRDFDKSLPPTSEAVVRKVLAKKPEDRYQTASALACAIAELKPALRPAPAKPKKEPTPAPPLAYGDNADTVAPEAEPTTPAASKTAPITTHKPVSRWVWALFATIGSSVVIALAVAGGNMFFPNTAKATEIEAPTASVARIVSTPSPIEAIATPSATPTDTATHIQTRRATETLVPPASAKPLLTSSESLTETSNPSRTATSTRASTTGPTPVPVSTSITATPAISRSPQIRVIQVTHSHLVSRDTDEYYYIFEWEVVPQTEWPLCPGRSYSDWRKSPKTTFVAFQGPDGRVLRPSTEIGPSGISNVRSYWLKKSTIESSAGLTYYFIITHYVGCNLETTISETVPFTWP